MTELDYLDELQIESAFNHHGLKNVFAIYHAEGFFVVTDGRRYSLRKGYTDIELSKLIEEVRLSKLFEVGHG